MERLLKRGLSEKEAAARIRSQLPLSQKINRSQCVIWNNGTADELRAQAQKWMKKVFT
jgi:dephospho-CoA kinase